MSWNWIPVSKTQHLFKYTCFEVTFFILIDVCVLLSTNFCGLQDQHLSLNQQTSAHLLRAINFLAFLFAFHKSSCSSPIAYSLHSFNFNLSVNLLCLDVNIFTYFKIGKKISFIIGFKNNLILVVSKKTDTCSRKKLRSKHFYILY